MDFVFSIVLTDSFLASYGSRLYQNAFYRTTPVPGNRNIKKEPQAGPRGSTKTEKKFEISYVFTFYLPRGNKPPNKTGHQVRQPFIFNFPTSLVMEFVGQHF